MKIYTLQSVIPHNKPFCNKKTIITVLHHFLATAKLYTAALFLAANRSFQCQRPYTLQQSYAAAAYLPESPMHMDPKKDP
jgi:hypothetical protein